MYEIYLKICYNFIIEITQLDNKPSDKKIVSVYRPRVDRCGRLWFIGMMANCKF